MILFVSVMKRILDCRNKKYISRNYERLRRKVIRKHCKAICALNKFDINKGLGNIILNDFDVSEDTLIGDGETKIKINGAVGNIIINTSE